MCETCGCDHLIDGITHEEMHALGIAHEHGRHHSENRNSREHLVEQNILSENNLIAARNRGYLLSGYYLEGKNRIETYKIGNNQN